ncbi:MAG: pilin [Saezia sp.]
MSNENNDHEKIKVHMPETSHMATKILFVMVVALGCLLVVFFIMDKGREEVIQRYEALAAGIVSTLPLQSYLMQYHAEHQSWPQADAALQAVEVTLPESVRAIHVDEQGMVTLTYTDKVQDGAQVYLKPLVAENGRIKWACLGEGLPEEILPKECSLIKS